MDIADQAQELIEELLAQSLQNRTTLAMPFSGACLSCDEPVEGQRQFCDAECRTDWENVRKRKFGAIR